MWRWESESSLWQNEIGGPLFLSLADLSCVMSSRARLTARPLCAMKGRMTPTTSFAPLMHELRTNCAKPDWNSLKNLSRPFGDFTTRDIIENP